MIEGELARIVEAEHQDAPPGSPAGPSGTTFEPAPEASMEPSAELPDEASALVPAQSRPAEPELMDEELLSPAMRGMCPTVQIEYGMVDLNTIDKIFKAQRIILARLTRDPDHPDPALALAFHNITEIVRPKY